MFSLLNYIKHYKTILLIFPHSDCHSSYEPWLHDLKETVEAETIERPGIAGAAAKVHDFSPLEPLTKGWWYLVVPW